MPAWSIPPPLPPPTRQSPDMQAPSPTEFDLLCTPITSTSDYRLAYEQNGTGVGDGMTPPSFDHSREQYERLQHQAQQRRGDESALRWEDGARPGGSGRESRMAIDQDTMHMWSNTPSSFELGDWETYLTTFKELLGSAERSVNGGEQ